MERDTHCDNDDDGDDGDDDDDDDEPVYYFIVCSSAVELLYRSQQFENKGAVSNAVRGVLNSKLRLWKSFSISQALETIMHHFACFDAYFPTGKCCIDIKATKKTETPNGYIRVTDIETGVVDNWEAKKAGRYLATINMDTCTTTRRRYTDWENAGLRTADTLNVWKSPSFSPELERMFGIDVSIGDGPDSYAPWIEIWELGVDALNSKYGGDAGSIEMKACMTGKSMYRSIEHLAAVRSKDS
jgi:hypothetical protein